MRPIYDSVLCQVLSSYPRLVRRCFWLLYLHHLLVYYHNIGQTLTIYTLVVLGLEMAGRPPNSNIRIKHSPHNILCSATISQHYHPKQYSERWTVYQALKATTRLPRSKLLFRTGTYFSHNHQNGNSLSILFALQERKTWTLRIGGERRTRPSMHFHNNVSARLHGSNRFECDKLSFQA